MTNETISPSSVFIYFHLHQHLFLNVILCVSVKFFLYAAEAILLGFQHYLVMLGTTVLIPTFLVPQMGGGHVSLYKYSSKQLTILDHLLSDMLIFSQVI